MKNNFKSGIGISTILIAGKNGSHPSAGLLFQKTMSPTCLETTLDTKV